jgi:cell filamentation protein
MDDKTSWTPGPEDNKLGLSDKNLINELEAKGIAAAELLVLDSTAIFRFQAKSF